MIPSMFSALPRIKRLRALHAEMRVIARGCLLSAAFVSLLVAVNDIVAQTSSEVPAEEQAAAEALRDRSLFENAQEILLPVIYLDRSFEVEDSEQNTVVLPAGEYTVGYIGESSMAISSAEGATMAIVEPESVTALVEDQPEQARLILEEGGPHIRYTSMDGRISRIPLRSAGVQPRSTYAPPKPDLKIAAISGPDVLRRGENGYQVTIYNQSGAGAARNFQVRLSSTIYSIPYSDGGSRFLKFRATGKTKFLGQCTTEPGASGGRSMYCNIGEIRGGDRYYLSFTVEPTRIGMQDLNPQHGREYRFHVWADSSQVIAEADETNNTRWLVKRLVE